MTKEPATRHPIAPFATGLALAALCVLGFALRLRGVGHLLPTITQLDASAVLAQVHELRVRADDGEAKTRTMYYPQLLSRVVSWLPAPEEPEAGAPAGVEEHLERASAPWIQVRIVSIALSMLLVPLTWLFAKRFVGSAWALLSAALVATSLLHVAFSVQERPHGTAASFMLLAVLAAMHLRRSPSLLAYLQAGVAAGLAVGALHYGGFAAFALVGAFVLCLRERRRRPLFDVAGIAIALLAIAVFFRWLYPFYFEGNSALLHFQNVRGEQALNLSGQPLLLERFRGGGFLAMASNLYSYDPALLLVAIVGLAALASRLRAGGWGTVEPGRRGDALVAASFLLPYLVVIGMYDESWERFLLAILPYLAALGAYGVRRCAGAIAAKARPLLAALAPAFAVVPAFQLGSARAAPDTLHLAAIWVEENVGPEDRVVVVPYIDLPVLDGDAAMADNAKRPWGSNWTRYQMRLREEQKLGPRREVFLFPGARLEAKKAIEEDPIGYFRGFGARYVVLAATDNEQIAWWKARDILMRENRLVGRFTCARVDTGSNVGLLQRFVTNPLRMPFFVFVMRSVRMGPVIEVFRLDDDR